MGFGDRNAMPRIKGHMVEKLVKRTTRIIGKMGKKFLEEEPKFENAFLLQSHFLVLPNTAEQGLMT